MGNPRAPRPLASARARPRGTLPRLTGLLLVAGSLAGLGVACGNDDGSATAGPSLAGVVREPPLEVAEAQLPLAGDGTPVAMQAADGELLVVYFGYTYCPDICPTTMNDLSIAVNDLPDELADRVTVAFVTVDPERDTVEVVEGYLGHFFEDGLALRTEDPDELGAAATAFGVQFEVADHELGDDAYDVAHTAVTYVVDDAGTVVVEWPFGFGNDDMTADLRYLLTEETT